MELSKACPPPLCFSSFFLAKRKRKKKDLHRSPERTRLGANQTNLVAGKSAAQVKETVGKCVQRCHAHGKRLH